MGVTRLLVINADDLGYSAERDRGIIECKEKSAISSASLMVNGVHATEAVAMAKKADLSIGLHLNITEGTPVGRTTYKTLVDKDGIFHGKMGFREELENGKIDFNEVREETICQIKKFQELTGELPAHVDGHQHAHVCPGVCNIFAEVLKEKGIHTTRMPCEIDLDKCNWVDASKISFYKDVAIQAERCKDDFRKHCLKFTDTFAGLSTSGESMTLEHVKLAIKKSFPASDPMTSAQRPNIHTCELMVHPGYPTGTVGGCGAGPDDFSQSEARKNEMDILCHPDIRKYLTEQNIQICSFNDCFQENP